MWVVIIISSNRLDICKPKRLLFFFFFSSISPVLLLTVPGAEALKQEVDGDGQNQNWESKKVELYLHKCFFYNFFVYFFFLAVNYCFPL